MACLPTSMSYIQSKIKFAHNLVTTFRKGWCQDMINHVTICGVKLMDLSTVFHGINEPYFVWSSQINDPFAISDTLIKWHVTRLQKYNYKQCRKNEKKLQKYYIERGAIPLPPKYVWPHGLRKMSNRLFVRAYRIWITINLKVVKLWLKCSHCICSGLKLALLSSLGTGWVFIHPNAASQHIIHIHYSKLTKIYTK